MTLIAFCADWDREAERRAPQAAPLPSVWQRSHRWRPSNGIEQPPPTHRFGSGFHRWHPLALSYFSRRCAPLCGSGLQLNMRASAHLTFAPVRRYLRTSAYTSPLIPPDSRRSMYTRARVHGDMDAIGGPHPRSDGRGWVPAIQAGRLPGPLATRPRVLTRPVWGWLHTPDRELELSHFCPIIGKLP